ncbi:DNA polymerase III subunit gamma/tau [bacterium 1XD42-8]|nr:DNA polymerase III subunit gamma/tau [Lachnospiraceae bacterium]RKJ53387.1 DNA polymerase III subunit gamma/tau [bacterium 1XD42-8]
MSYTALYRKFRPQSFIDVKGQEHIVITLKNQIKADRIGHAYLFCGTRGTGKTTIAKIFAKAVNCESPIDGSPCGECKSCRTISAGASMNVIEIDAASNNGVDSIREIREEVAYSPAEGKYKVYIIDEVHMLSIGAFNALLKTLEEPPSYVIFILATTEVHKIPVTILSRCQRYDFRRITMDTMIERLKDLMEIEQVKVEEKAFRLIAKTADGSMRDALSLLEQCTGFYFGQELTYDKALEVLGAVDTGVFSKLLSFLLEKDSLSSIRLLEEIVMQGRELNQFVLDFTWYLRNLLLVKASHEMEDVVDMSSENLSRLKEEAKLIEMNTLLRFIRIFSKLSGQIKFAMQKRVVIEIALIKLCTPNMEENLDSLTERIKTLEEKIQKGSFEIAVSNPKERVEKEERKREKAPLPKAVPEDIREVVKNWNSIVGTMEPLFQNALKGVQLSSEGDKLLIVTDKKLTAACFGQEEHRKELLYAIESKIQKKVDVIVKKLETGQEFDETYPDISKMIHMDIEIED